MTHPLDDLDLAERPLGLVGRQVVRDRRVLGVARVQDPCERSGGLSHCGEAGEADAEADPDHDPDPDERSASGLRTRSRTRCATAPFTSASVTIRRCSPTPQRCPTGRLPVHRAGLPAAGVLATRRRSEDGVGRLGHMPASGEHHPAFEEYCECIFELQEDDVDVIQARIAERLKVSRPAVSEMIHRLEAEKLITIDGGHIGLTVDGVVLAQRSSVGTGSPSASSPTCSACRGPTHITRPASGST